MGSSTIPVLLVTANVGSIFEDPVEMLKVWTEEFLSTVSKLDPKFIALHCQEVGGKNYELSMKHVEHFVKLLMTSNELRLFDKIRVFLDEDYSSAENFTALGNLYFIHKSLDNILIWDFKDSQFLPVQGTEINSGNIEGVITKEKAKFPQDFFPECKWSRKGFMRTRWSLNGTVIDLVNIHLFHDASNFVAMEPYPSVYCKNRRRALQHTLQRFHDDAYETAPFFLFGDFNFRTDTDGVIKKLTDGLKSTRVQNNKNNESTKLQYTGEDSKLILTVGKKEFNHSDHQTIFLNPTSEWLKTFDKELEVFEDALTEYPVNFPPSYPFEEKLAKATSYMQTRCPAWCDRVLLSHTAKELVCDSHTVDYGLIGINTCMGDHKPVYLRVDLRANAGTIMCCDHAPYACLPDKCRCCRLFASIKINIVDMSDYITNSRTSYANISVDSKLLHEPITRDMLSHDPYTPESGDSPLHSPLSEKESTDARRDSVSPLQLKHRLESIIKRDLRKSPKLMTRSASENVQLGFMRDNFFRNRAMSEIPKNVRARLISSDSVNSLYRLQSHHSSSDEDWFEFENESVTDCLKVCQENTGSLGDVSRDKKQIRIVEDDKTPRKHCRLKFKTHQKLNCCAIV
ncbi:hypothetical protein NQ315_010767 [Exocentrus adspersus]|uniref:inositol-polyphosphate 5-phosphatase n=1 Tax=Exocentrus adspersus TaxID=1586481 RepID=A0AAV8VUK9_9CUCU|nr:hypothetical protein NQ315_010767 [Exocentrus adspersus]